MEESNLVLKICNQSVDQLHHNLYIKNSLVLVVAEKNLFSEFEFLVEIMSHFSLLNINNL